MSITDTKTPHTNTRVWNYLKLFVGKVGIHYTLDDGKLNGTVTGYYDLISKYAELGYFNVFVNGDNKISVYLTDKGRELREEIRAFRNL